MYKAILTVVLEIDVKTEKECNKILEEMMYDFQYVKIEESIGKQLIETDLIISQEITEQKIIKI